MVLPGGPAAANQSIRPVAATRAFGRLLHHRFGDVHGYWTCPRGQAAGPNEIDCLGEVRIGGRFHQTFARADTSRPVVRFTLVQDVAWTRRWSRYSRTVLENRHAPGTASVNSPAYDWGWIALGANASKREGRTFTVDGRDGPTNNGLERFYTFRCRVTGRLIGCTNQLGDSIRYRP